MSECWRLEQAESCPITIEEAKRSERRGLEWEAGAKEAIPSEDNTRRSSMRRHWDIFKKSAPHFPVKHLIDNLEPKNEKKFWRSFKKIYFLIWGLFIFVDFLWATVDLLHFSPLPIFSSNPIIITNQNLSDSGKIAGVSNDADNEIIKSPSPQSSEPIYLSPALNSTVNKADISLTILNGSGKAGQAAVLKKKLEGLGFKVASIGTVKTAIATMVIYHHDSPDKAKLVAEALSDYHPTIQISPDIDTDVLIIIGKK